MVQRIEELIMNSDPSANMMLDHGFLIRLYNTNDICTINQVSGYNNNLLSIINSHANKLKNIGINPCYRIIHDKSYQALDVELQRMGYDIIDRGVVLAIDIEDMQKELFMFANFYEQGIWYDDKITPDWLDDYKALKRMDDKYEEIFEKNIYNSLEEKMTFAFFQDNRLLSMAYTTIIDDYIVINDLFVEPKYRGLDYGKKMLKAIMTKGLQKNCKVVVCDVREDQEEMLNMLKKEGFAKVYSYQYRAKEIV